ncbi:phosphoglycolate phosphatase [Desertibaculum subflavum]|uniref:phosphoglycolate phosphatase n=1 Tax=Desertibaculum subflavum TaxID=2268458 RepID=UPI000E66A958
MIKRLNRSAIVFDLDGTLVESAPDLHGALVHVLEQSGRPTVTLEDVRHMVGDGARAMLERGFAATGGPLGSAELDAAMQLFLRHYGANVARLSHTFEGVEEVLAGLQEAGAALGVCTNKPQALTEALLEELAIDQHFGAVVGGDALPVRKPDPAHLTATLERLGRSGAPAVMVGDSRNDVAAARGAGLPVVLVSFGYTTIPVRELGADIVIDHFADLPAALAELGFRD